MSLFLRVAPRLPPGILFSVLEDGTLSDADSFTGLGIPLVPAGSPIWPRTAGPEDLGCPHNPFRCLDVGPSDKKPSLVPG